jgi:hypothetical protein
MKIRSSLRLAVLLFSLHLSLSRGSRAEKARRCYSWAPLLSSSLSQSPSSPTSRNESPKTVRSHTRSLTCATTRGWPHRGQPQRKPAAACQMVAHAPVVGGDAFWWSECNAVGRSSYVVGAFHRRALPSPGFACCSCPRWGPPSGGGAGRVRVIVHENAPCFFLRLCNAGDCEGGGGRRPNWPGTPKTGF